MLVTVEGKERSSEGIYTWYIATHSLGAKIEPQNCTGPSLAGLLCAHLPRKMNHKTFHLVNKRKSLFFRCCRFLHAPCCTGQIFARYKLQSHTIVAYTTVVSISDCHCKHDSGTGFNSMLESEGWQMKLKYLICT